MIHHNPGSLATLAVSALLFGACAAAPSTAHDFGGTERIDGWSDESLDLYFVPGSNAEDRIAAELEAAQDSIHVAMYNLRSSRLGWLLLDKQEQGLDVEVLWDAKQMGKDYNTLDDDLGAAGLNIVPIHNDRHAYATLHDKLAVIDGEQIFFGSGNWGDSALFDNNETVLALTSPTVAAVVEAELDEIRTGTKQPRDGDSDSHVQMYFSPDDRLDQIIEAEIDAATDHILVAVFSLRLSSLAHALVRAKDRGVDVHVVTDLNQSSTTSVDEILLDAGIEVVEALNTTGPHTAMHHKFMVVDGHTTVVGSYNWTWTATASSYEDLAVIADDSEVAAAFEGEFGRLWTRYAPQLDNPVVATHPVAFSAWCDATSWGDQLVLVGDLPALGAWDPAAGVPLSGTTWPTWTAQLDLRAGARFEYKLVLQRADGSVWWEQGGNRIAVVPTDDSEPRLELNDAFRR